MSLVDTYRYVDARGELVFEVLRLEPKKFQQRRPDGNGSWVYKLDGSPRPLYRLPQLLVAVAAGQTVYVVEGEKDVHALEEAGCVATCNSGGSNGWRPSHAEALAGADVVVIVDRDAQGRKWGAQVVDSLLAGGARVAVREAAQGKDAADHLAAGLTVEQLMPASLDDPDQASAPAIDPGPGWQLLDDVAVFLARFVVFAAVEQLHAVALWVLHTHAIDAAESSPRLAVLSPVKRSGKTRLEEVLALVVREPLRTTSISPAALFRIVGKTKPTVLLDEVDTIFGPKTKDNHEDLRALLNSGHRRGAVVVRCVGEGSKMQAKSFPVFCPVALAGIGNLPDTIADRAVIVRLKRRRPSERVDAFRHRYVRAEAAELAERAAAWATLHHDVLAEADPELPAELHDRAADCWETLVAIADAAGGEWPARARSAALALTGHDVGEDPEVAARLLADLRTIFDDAGVDRLSSDSLVRQLSDLEEAPWGGWNKGSGITPRDLARQLRGFDITPKKLRVGEATMRGYERAAFADAWDRYLLPGALDPASQAERGEQPRSEGIFDVEQALFGEGGVPDEKPPLTSDVPHVPPESGEEGERCLSCGSEDVWVHTYDDRALCQPCFKAEAQTLTPGGVHGGR